MRSITRLESVVCLSSVDAPRFLRKEFLNQRNMVILEDNT